MWLYFFLIIFSISVSKLLTEIFGQKKGTKIAIITIFSVLGFLAMFRSVEIGKDTSTYVQLFYNIGNSSDINVFFTRYEYGYVVLNKFISSLFNNHQYLLIITSIYIYILLIKFVKDNTRVAWYSAIIFISLRYFEISMTGIRQMLAISTLIFAHKSLINGKTKKYFVYLILAISFHTVSLIFIIPYFIYKRNRDYDNKIVLKITLIMMPIFFFLDRIMEYILIIFPRYQTYYLRASEEVKSYTVSLFFIHLTIFIMMNLIMRKYKESNDKFFLDNLYMYYQYITVLTLLFSIKVDIFIRISNIFSVFLIVSLPHMISKINNKKERLLIYYLSSILFILFSVIVLYYRPEWQSTYPYKFFWR